MKFFRSHILICTGSSCQAAGSLELKEEFIKFIEKKNLSSEVKIVETGCFGFCRIGPNMVIYPEGTLYNQVQIKDIPEIVEKHLIEGKIVERLLYKEPESESTTVTPEEIKFFKYQKRIALRNCGVIDPESIKEAIAHDAYFALGKALKEMKAEDVVNVISKSGLRGRGGGGFPTGLKWKFAAKVSAEQKYIICNADEGDPGAFMDRSILEGDPHSIVEGMAIAGYAIGASKGYVYCRAEYPIAVNRLKKAIDDAKEKGLLGKNIFNTGFNFDLEIRLGAGAFVCGEETALIASIEGKRGEPKPKPPFPAVSGLWGKPTIINNVETLANIATIIREGWEWFKAIGTEKSPGTKVFALAGKINNNGLVEVPMGTKLGEVIFDIGGGLPDGKKFKAAQTGGPSGGCIPSEHLNVPIDYESLSKLGTIMGSGGLIIMDEDTCMVDLAKFFLDFVKDESCGKCTPCRVGSTRMLEILDRITKGEGKEEDLDLLEEIGQYMKDNALCGLGQSAPNPVLSTLRYFRHEYLAHIRDKHCPASVCAALFNSPCQNACPANVDVPIYVDLIAEKNYKKAYKVIQEENPFPMVCGRVCHHPCEGKCNRGKIEEPIAIRSLKRFASDYVLETEGIFPVPEIEEGNGKKIAVIGSGPSGLTCAFYLRKLGYEVTIFEKLPVAGGMLTVGIPEYRLPKNLLQEEINVIKSMGVEIITNIKIGEDISLSELKEKGFEAIYIAVGAHKNRKLNIEGEELEGVMSGIELLKDINLGKDVYIADKKVVVVGGGNVAVDAARSAWRLGAKEVTVVYRRSKIDMPAMDEEIKELLEEGIELDCLTNPVKIISQNGKVKAVECLQMKSGDFDSSGRRKPVPMKDSNFTIDADIIIPAIGQEINDSFNKGNLQVNLSNGTVKAERDSSTNIDGIFAGGDCVIGPDTVVQAVKEGKKAAVAIDKYFGGSGKIIKEKNIIRRYNRPVIEEERAREKMACISLEKRKNNFMEVEKGYSEELAVKEAIRCLRCDVKDQ